MSSPSSPLSSSIVPNKPAPVVSSNPAISALSALLLASKGGQGRASDGAALSTGALLVKSNADDRAQQQQQQQQQQSNRVRISRSRDRGGIENLWPGMVPSSSGTSSVSAGSSFGGRDGQLSPSNHSTNTPHSLGLTMPIPIQVGSHSSVATSSSSYMALSPTSVISSSPAAQGPAAALQRIVLPYVPASGSILKRACQGSGKSYYSLSAQADRFVCEYDTIHHLAEWRIKNSHDPLFGLSCCALCDPESWTFQGSQYDSSLAHLYADTDGCIPSSVILNYPKFIVPWRYRNKKTGAISWKIFHLCGGKVESSDSETIIVNPFKDRKLMHTINQVREQYRRYEMGRPLVDYLLRVIQEILGDYGLPGGPTSSKADENLLKQMKKQGHNLMLLCEVEIGLCRHKALLFKILCDVVGLECALVTGYSTAGRHQWNIVTLPGHGDFLIDPTSPYFTWAKKGSQRAKGYKIKADDSFGHAGFTAKDMGLL
ncbi:ethylene-responsive protein kinase Le-CTR1-domain-containing protein [Polychytrium aggregatum]|uniref:ethylene-responsive protein kinase Le-CTR1-domain-containing protein n=1 Tax=Polychytrium aggregatum TaxID=110093 RepID=UPI0022FDB2E7|nr:ethylene-responsive protein kinase Le-CTR1-domain-containing protein [Polychytrium aggregatum]KAI9208118.1 ethylene-responsive protein kinase Le-CTR1-domain-containing protein [Polychytrium aggregatum]